MARQRSGAILCDIEEYLNACSLIEETEEDDEAELEFLERTNSIDLPIFQLSCWNEPVSTYARVVKILIMGSSQVGKTSIVNQIIGERFTTDYVPTKGVQMFNKYIHLGGEVNKIQIIDSSGAPEIEPYLESYLSTAAGVLLVYDVHQPSTFGYCIEQLNGIPEHAQKAIIANKCEN